MKKVLFIACLYPPIANSGTQRSVKFANFLPDFGWEPIVLTVENSFETALDPALLDEIRPGTRVERVLFWSDVLGANIGRALRAFLPERRVAEGLGWRIRGLWNIPDQWAFWRPTAVKRALEIYQSEGFDCIYATGFPWTSFLVAREVAKKTGRPYVLDFRDLWTSWEAEWETSASWLARRLMRHQELAVIKGASAIVSVSDSLVRVLSDMLPSGSKSPVVCITNGYDPKEFLMESDVTRPLGKVRIVYTGVWKKGYSPSMLYEALLLVQRDSPAAMQRLDVVCAGFPPGTFGGNSPENLVRELGRIPHRDAIALMKSADALFLPVSEGDYALGSLPGKLFEYLGSGNPIIAAVPALSEVAQVLNGIGGASLVAPGDVSGLAKVLVDTALAGGPAWGSQDPSLTACYQRRNLTARLAEVFSAVSKGPGVL